MDISSIKEENRAGLKYAYDESGNYLAAKDAVPGKTYICPLCECEMYLTSRNGRPYFARKANHYHTKPACITADEKGERTFENTTPEKLISSLCHVSARRAQKERVDLEENSSSVNNSKTHSSQSEQKNLTFTSLKQIADSNVYEIKGNEKQGEHKISDYLLTYKYGLSLFKDPNFALGPRIIHARYDSYNIQYRTLTFIMYSKNGDSVRFQLIFFTQSDFNQYLNKFTKLDDIDGKTKRQKIHQSQDVLIASDDWRKIPHNTCGNICYVGEKKCASCLSLYQATFVTSKQLYLMDPID